jgi:hypothetical protein
MKGKFVNTLSPENHAATKVIAKAGQLVDQRKVVQVAPPDQKAREVGRLKQRGDELAEAVEKYRKAGGQP